MVPRILVVDDDLDTHQFLRDLLEINFAEVTIDKALDRDSFVKRLREANNAYDLLLVDYHLEGNGSGDIVAIIQEESPDLLGKTILLNGSPDAVADDIRLKDVPNVRKPFSLDSFSEIIKKTCCVERRN